MSEPAPGARGQPYRRPSGDRHRAAVDALRARTRGHVRARPRGAARQDSAADRAAHAVQRVLGLPARREAAGAAHRLRGRLSRTRRRDTMRLRVGQGVVGAAVEEGRPILVNDIRQEPRYMGPLRNMLSQLAVPMRRKGQVIGALNLLNEVEGAFTDAGRGAAAAVRRARRRGDRERAALPVGTPVRGHARDAGRDRPRDVVDSRSRRAAHAHRQPHQAAHRLPHVRHPAAQRGERRSSR